MHHMERGSASLEFVIVALGVLIPILAVTVSVSVIQRAQFAVTEIARQGVRAFALSATSASGNRAIRRTARLTLSDFGLDGTARFTVTCSESPCHYRGGMIRLTSTLDVPLVMVPALPGIETLATVPVRASATHRVPLPVVP